MAIGEGVLIAGKRYAIDGDVLIESYPAWPEVIRTVGKREAAGRVNLDSWVMGDFRAGWGYYVASGPILENPADMDPSYFGFFDLQGIETRWYGQVTLGSNELASTHENDGTGGNPDHEYLRMFTLHDGQLIVTGNTNESTAKFNVSTNKWDESDDLTAGAYSAYHPRCAVRHGGDTYLFGGTDTGAAGLYRKWTGSAWATLTPSTDVSHPISSCVSYHGNLYAACYNNTNKRVEIWKSTDDGDNWAVITDMWVSEAGHKMAEVVEYFDSAGSPAVFLVTDSGLYLLDLANETLATVRIFATRLSTAFVNIVKPTVSGTGFLYIPRGKALIEFHYSGNWRDVSPLTQARVPTAYDSSGNHIRWIVDAEPWLFVMFGAVTRSSIWAWDGQAWHYIWHTGVTNGESVRSFAVWYNTIDGAYNLHIVYYPTSGTKSLFKRFENVMVNPVEFPGHQYTVQGHIVTPWYHGGMSEESGALVYSSGAFADLDTIVNNKELVTIETALEYSDTYESASDRKIIRGSDSDVKMKYVSGAGFSCRVWRHKITLDRDSSTTTNSPIVYHATTAHRKKIPKLYQFTFVIDLTKSATDSDRDHHDAQEALTNLLDAEDSVPLVPFGIIGGEAFPDGNATRYVDIKRMPTIASSRANIESGAPRVESGKVRVLAQELV